MKKSFCRLAAFLLLITLALSLSCRKQRTESSCLVDDQIPEAELDRILEASANLIRSLERGRLDEVYAAGIEELKLRQNQDQFILNFELFFDAFGAFDFPLLEEAYYLTSQSRDDQVLISCNLGEAGVDDYHMVPANQELAVVIWRARTDLEPMIRLVTIMQKVEGAWRLAQLNLHPATYKKRGHDYYLEQAVKFREENRLHLAHLYFQIVIQLSKIGPNVDEFAVRVVRDQLSQLRVDYLPEGETQIWTTPEGDSFQVYQVSPVYNQGRLLIQVSHLSDLSVRQTDELKAEARKLASFLDQLFPEYRLGFDGFIVTAAFQRGEEQFLAWHETILFKDLDHPSKGTCLVGNEMPEPELESLMTEAAKLGRLIESGNWSGLYDAAGERLKKQLTRDRLVLDLERFAGNFGQVEKIEIEELYLFESESKDEEIEIPCRLGESGMEDIFRLPANRKMAVLVFSGQTELEQIRFSLLLEAGERGFELARISLHPATLKGRTYSHHLDRAMKFQRSGRNDPAALHYRVAAALSDIGPYVDEFIVRRIETELRKLKPEHIIENGPRSWTLPSGAQYQVFRAGPAYEQGRLWVEVAYLTASRDDGELTKQARELADFLAQRLPEIGKDFDGIRIAAHRDGPEADPRLHRFLFSELSGAEP